MIRKCEECQKNFITKKSSHKRFCEDCRDKRLLDNRKKQYEFHKEFRIKYGFTRYRDKKCEVCGNIMKNVYFTKKYCAVCYRMIINEKIRLRYERLKMDWEELSEKEKARRMNIISKKLLNGEKI